MLPWLEGSITAPSPLPKFCCDTEGGGHMARQLEMFSAFPVSQISEEPFREGLDKVALQMEGNIWVSPHTLQCHIPPCLHLAQCCPPGLSREVGRTGRETMATCASLGVEARRPCSTGPKLSYPSCQNQNPSRGNSSGWPDGVGARSH